MTSIQPLYTGLRNARAVLERLARLFVGEVASRRATGMLILVKGFVGTSCPL